METQANHILLVEDDQRLAELTREYLEGNGFRVSLVADGVTAVSVIVDTRPDLVVLDLMLPGQDGFAVCRQVRPAYAGPIVMLTARDEDIDQLLGLELGADDYITKPVQPRLLLARIRAVLRRVAPVVGTGTGSDAERALRFGELNIDPAARTVTRCGRPVELTTAEFDLLSLLAEHRGEVLSRDQILSSVRGIDYDGSDRSIDLRISRLRRKLERDPERPALIKTVRGRGYLFTGESSC